MRAVPVLMLAGLAATESAMALDRFRNRKALYRMAAERAKATGKTLVVVGDPDGGAHTRLARAYDCGDICVDLNGCSECPVAVAADITQGPIEQIADGSAVVFVSCVLEYVSDFQAAWAEVLRMAGTVDDVFLVEVQPWTLTGAMYPGAKQVLLPVDVPDASRPAYVAEPVTMARKVTTFGTVAGLLLWALWPREKDQAK